MTALKPLEKVKAKLVHVSLGLTGRKGLLSPVYAAVAKKNVSIQLYGELQQCLKDWT